MTTTQTCLICQWNGGAKLYEDDLWFIRHADPAGVPGWMFVVSKRHVAGPTHFNDRETAAFGPSLRHFERVLEQVTGALRIYTAALGESYPHFHAHMVPRYPTMPRDAKGWSVFDLERAVRDGELSVDRGEIDRISAAYAKALAATPRPW